MTNSFTIAAHKDTSDSLNNDSYGEHKAFSPDNKPMETSERLAVDESKYLGIQRKARQVSDPVSVAIIAGMGKRTEKIVRANKQLAKVCP